MQNYVPSRACRHFYGNGCFWSKLLSVLAIFAFAFALQSSASASDLTLVSSGRPASVIVLPKAAAKAEQQAADELVEHVELMSGAKLQVIESGASTRGLAPIYIGTAANDALEAVVRQQGEDPYAFALIVDDASVQLRGLSPEGTRSAAYELLEQLGVRWYMPGEIGRIVPKRDTVVLSLQKTVQVPSYKGRRGPRNDADHWNDRLRMGGEGRYGTHGIAPFSTKAQRREARADNPEFLALVDGVRELNQLCLTNGTNDIEQNEVLNRVIDYYRGYMRRNPDTKVLDMGPNDGHGYCECEYCRALDPPATHTTPFGTPHPSYTDRYVWFFNHITDALSDEFPDVRVGFYAYSLHLLPPHKAEPKDNLAISLAPILTCRLHGPNNPICPESNFPLWAYEKWKPYAGEFMADRGYLYNLADPGFPFSMVHRVREEIPAYHDRGVRIWESDPSDSWGTHNPSMYVVAKLLWNHEADVDAMLDEFYTLFYGPASEPMAAYHTHMDTTVRDADFHTGSVWDLPNIYDPQTRREARAYLEQAAALAGKSENEAYATRIEITKRGLDFLDAYCESRERRDALDFAGEKEAMEQARAIRDSLLQDYEFPMLFPRHSKSLFDRFVETPTMANYNSIHGGEEAQIVARLDSEWQFQLDPYSWGHYAGLHKPESKGGNWQTIRTDTSWSNQGLRYYFSQAWYRQVVDIPADYKGRTVYIWFAGVDNTAEVWVNGKFVGANHDGAEFDLDAYGSAFRPFQFDATDAIHFGEPNVVTVRTVRPKINELGTGGLMGPAMFYTPGEIE